MCYHTQVNFCKSKGEKKNTCVSALVGMQCPQRSEMKNFSGAKATDGSESLDVGPGN